MYPVAFQPFLYLHLPPTGENTGQLNYRTSEIESRFSSKRDVSEKRRCVCRFQKSPTMSSTSSCCRCNIAQAVARTVTASDQAICARAVFPNAWEIVQTLISR